MSGGSTPSFWTRLRRGLTDWLLEVLVPPILFILRHLPLAARCWLLQALVSCLTRMPGFRPQRQASLQLEQVLALPRSQALSSARQVFRRLAELVAVMLGPTPELLALAARTPVRGLSQLLTPLRRGQAVLLLTGHLGNWESMGGVLAQALAREGFTLHVVARPLRQPSLQRRLTALRNAQGIGLLLRGEEAAFVSLVERLKQPTVVAMLVDHDTRAPGLMVPFLGRPAHTVSGPVLLALRTGAAVVTGFSFHSGPGQWTVELAPLELPAAPALVPVGESGDPWEATPALEGWTQEALTRLNARISDAIRRDPAGWTWMHHRWRSISRGWFHPCPPPV